MQIKKITIDEYGALSHREFTLIEGMNIFEGNNESGKSTILSFIRFMLYGMPRKSSGTVTDRDRGISWNGGVAGGSMELSIPDKSGEIRDYRIERHGQLRGAAGHENYAEVVKIIDLATGTEVFEGQEPGKALLGISQETFVSTSCIRQLECADVDGTGVNASIENLLFAANEGINTEKATNRLDEIRKTLLHKNEKGGQIFDLEAQKLVLEEKLAHAREQAETIIAKEAAVESAAALEAELGVKLRDCENIINLYEACSILRRFDELHTREARFDELGEDLKTLEAEKGYPGKLPTRETVEHTESLLRELSEATTTAALADAALAKETNAADGNRELATCADTIEIAGGSESLSAQFSRLVSHQRKDKVFSFISLIFGFVLLIVGSVSLLSALSFEGVASFLTPIRQTLLPIFNGNLLLYQIACGATGGIALALTVLGFLLSFSSKKAKDSRASLLLSIGISDTDCSSEAFKAHMETCLEHRKTCDAYDQAVAEAKYYAESCHRALTECTKKCCDALSAFEVSCEESNPESTAEALRSSIDILTELCREKERIENDRVNLNALIDSIKQDLSPYNENVLRSAIGNTNPAEILAATDMEKVEMTRRYQKEQLSAATSKRITMEKELIALTAAAENPAKLAAKLDEMQTKLAEMRFQYQSLIMAIEAIETASDSLRRSITPRIREKAGAFMRRITDGKYGELGISADMSISIFAGNSTRSIDVLSKGTRDAAYLSLRMALANIVCPGNPPTLTMDEGLSLLDEERAVRVLQVLHEYSEQGGQCILFTCHKREGELMRNIGKYQHILLS